MEHFFEPTGRLIMSIGKDLIKDLPAAVVELVKNSYDADATYVNITYERKDNSLEIIIEDDGHGMSTETVTGVWMVPSTDFKLREKKSPGGRIYQGQKGIGRYAASLLGNRLQLITVQDGIETNAIFDWGQFNSDKKLSEIPIDIKSSVSTAPNGTKLIICHDDTSRLLESISENDVLRIEKELAKLLSSKIDFRIGVTYKNFYSDNQKNRSKNIEHLVFSDAYHYQLKGIIDDKFNYNLEYTNFYNNEKKILEGSFIDSIGSSFVSCGTIYIDYRVYDKDAKGIELIKNFINGNQKNSFSKRDIKNMLIDQSGISIYRNEFRIRPYGDKGFDWLNLDSKRVQNPSLAIGSEQINGQIRIENEEDSGLKEKSARDGLYENLNFFTLERIALLALNLLEKERFKYRQKKDKGYKTLNLETLFDLDPFRNRITHSIDKVEHNITNAPEKAKEHFSLFRNEIDKEVKLFEKEKEKDFSNVKRTIAIYQKHITLGGVISVVLHEGRKPLAWYNNKLPSMKRYISKLLDNNKISESISSKLVNHIDKLSFEAKRLSKFFSTLDPLASNNVFRRKQVDIQEEIERVLDLFSTSIEERNIKIECSIELQSSINLIKEDLYMALTNLIDNAIFWVDYTHEAKKIIRIKAYQDINNTIIEIIDNGPGMSSEDIKDGLLFVPGYSNKNKVIEENGTGLGLSIAGMAIERNNGKLEAVDYNSGAFFRITLNNQED